MEPATGVMRNARRPVRTAVTALFAGLTVGYALAILVVSGLTAALDQPRDAVGVLICLVLTSAPFVVGVFTCRRARKRGLKDLALVRHISVRLLATGIGLLIALVVLAGPT